MAVPGSKFFEGKKQKILKELSVPEDQYTDFSPKGSVDVGIRPLINDINQLEGAVTTSSCAGRISVFVEGSGGNNAGALRDPEITDPGSNHDPAATAGKEQIFAPTGGKGSGRWAFVSHDPVAMDEESSGVAFHELFGLILGDGNIALNGTGGQRLVRFSFEPMILHIMTASLDQARPILAAASSTGFRESGLQGLRCLDEPDACPMVAVRSSGLALESIIGYVSADGSAQSLVTEQYLRMLVAIANERFVSNYSRVEAFRKKLLELFSARTSARSAKRAGWEDANERRERKRAEGLQRRENEQLQRPRDPKDASVDENDLLGFLDYEDS